MSDDTARLRHRLFECGDLSVGEAVYWDSRRDLFLANTSSAPPDTNSLAESALNEKDRIARSGKIVLLLAISLIVLGVVVAVHLAADGIGGFVIATWVAVALTLKVNARVTASRLRPIRHRLEETLTARSNAG
ncbi:MAG: hypothetical protein AAGC80_05255 [Rhodococcus sp. (in: high G+C Gram-positive bacteria)]